ncbi:hypothetical protein DFH09DRAFT_994075 [Mycena vulgaris]|nr:hypothetical protein DFH09DRAFT_994075 [Mycena vulgaris]
MSTFPKSAIMFGYPGLTNVENQLESLIEAAEAKIERLTAQIHELTFMREREHTVLSNLRSMVAPIAKLPTELLAEIFKISVHMHDGTTLEHSTPHTLSPLFQTRQISQTCSRWRQIVLGMPQLWAEGVLDICSKSTMTEAAYLTGLKTVLTRSSPLPISVSLDSRPGAEVSPALVQTIIPSAPRWQNLEIFLNSFGPLHDLPSGTFEALETLQLQCFLQQTRPIETFLCCPRLRNLSMAIFKTSDPRLFRLPWAQLTNIDLKVQSMGACRGILLQCSSVVKANFMTSQWDFELDVVDSPVVVLPHLRELSVRFHRGDLDGIAHVGPFFIPLALPALQVLKLTFRPKLENVWPTQEFSQFQSLCPGIEQITLNFSAIDSEGLVTLLRHAPSLTTFVIYTSPECLDDAALRALRHDEGALAPLAPKLRELRLECVGDAFERGSLEAAIRSRWWTDLSPAPPRRIARLDAVWISRSNSDDELFSDEIQNSMQDLVEQGLILDLY